MIIGTADDVLFPVLVGVLVLLVSHPGAESEDFTREFGHVLKRFWGG